MRRVFCVFSALMNPQSYKGGNTMEPIKDFKEWKFIKNPSYAELPIDLNPEFNVPKAVKNAVFSKVNFKVPTYFIYYFESCWMPRRYYIFTMSAVVLSDWRCAMRMGLLYHLVLTWLPQGFLMGLSLDLIL